MRQLRPLRRLQRTRRCR